MNITMRQRAPRRQGEAFVRHEPPPGASAAYPGANPSRSASGASSCATDTPRQRSRPSPPTPAYQRTRSTRAFGGKPGLVRAIRVQALEGEGPVPAEQRSDAVHARETDGRKIIETWGALTAEVAPKVAPILLLMRAAAATEPEGKALLEEMDADRLRRMSHNARRLRDGGHLRRGNHTRASRGRSLDLQRARALRASGASSRLVAPPLRRFRRNRHDRCAAMRRGSDRNLR